MKVFPKTQAPYVGAGSSPIDVDMVNMFETPDVKQVKWTHATLRPGDCILIPASKADRQKQDKNRKQSN